MVHSTLLHTISWHLVKLLTLLHISVTIIVIQVTLTLKMTTAQVVERSITVNNNSPILDYIHPDNQTQPTFL